METVVAKEMESDAHNSVYVGLFKYLSTVKALR